MASAAKRLGVIGAGNIGGAVAANLLADGHAVAVHDVDPARCAALVRAGAVRADTPAAVAERSEITFTSLPSPAVMEAVAQAWRSEERRVGKGCGGGWWAGQGGTKKNECDE